MNDALLTPRTLLDLPSEILLHILDFSSLHDYNSLYNTSVIFRPLLKDLVVVIADSHKCMDKEGQTSGAFLTSLRRVHIDSLSLEVVDDLLNKYTYFVFDMDTLYLSPVHRHRSNQIKLLKIILANLQERHKYHTVVINSTDISSNILLRSLIPRMNTPCLEFAFPQIRNINGYDDLRILDNTRCYMHNLKRLTIGSLSFQLFELSAPNLEVFDHSNQIVTRAIYDSVNVRRVNYTSFLSFLVQTCSKTMRCIELIGHVEPVVLQRFDNLEILHIYGDHVGRSFDARGFGTLKDFVMCKCDNLEYVVDLPREIPRIEIGAIPRLVS